MRPQTARDRLIVALDMSTRDEAMALVDRLADSVVFYKVGWQLFMGGQWHRLLDELRPFGVFVDLKVPGDIGNTIASVVGVCLDFGVRMLTLSNGVTPQAIRAACQRRGDRPDPRLLVVPVLSSMDLADLEETTGVAAGSVEDYVVQRSGQALAAGCDGVIVSGKAIARVRERFADALVVSPGIRPAWSGRDDHKRSTTPAEAIRSGSDYLVVGRPIRTAPDPRAAARRVVEEIESAL